MSSVPPRPWGVGQVYSAGGKQGRRHSRPDDAAFLLWLDALPALFAPPPGPAQAQSVEDPRNLSIDQLANLNISTKDSSATPCGLLDVKVERVDQNCPVDQNGLLQYGGTFGTNRTCRVYGQELGVGNSVKLDGASGFPAGERSLDGASGDDPCYQVSFRSSMNLPPDLEFDFGTQAVDARPDPVVESHVQANARLAWHITPSVGISSSGTNLLAACHLQAVTPGTAVVQVQRSICLGLRWKF